MEQPNRDLVEALLDPNEAQRVLDLSLFIYEIQSMVINQAQLLAALSQEASAKNDDDAARKLDAAKSWAKIVSDTLEKYWLGLRLHHHQLTTKTEEAGRVVH